MVLGERWGYRRELWYIWGKFIYQVMQYKPTLITFSYIILGCLCINLVEKPAWALPFGSSPQSFQQYVNSIKWRGGANLYFENLYSCSKNVYSVSNENSPRIVNAISNYNGWNETLRNMELPWGGTGDNPAINFDRVEYKPLKDARKNRDAWWKLVEQYRTEDTLTYETYSCQGYVTISDPRGRKVCECTVGYDGQKGASYTGRSCVWR